MVRLTKGIVVTAFGVIFAASLLSQSPSATSSPVANQSPHADSGTEVAVLRAQSKLMQDYDDRLLSTVHWTLATIAGIAVLLIGFSWFSNYRIYDRDKAALAQELNTTINERLISIKKELDDITKKQIRDVSEKTKESVKTAITSAISSLDWRVKALDKQALRSKYDTLQAEARYWELKKVKSNELTQYRQMLPIAIELKAETAISTCLDALLTLMRGGERLFHAYVSDLVATLDSLPPKYAAQVSALKKFL